jgi:TolA-binding protein
VLSLAVTSAVASAARANAEVGCIADDAERAFACAASPPRSGQRPTPGVSAPAPARTPKTRVDTTKPSAPSAAATALERRRYESSARTKELLVREAQLLVGLLAATARSAPDRPKLLRRTAESFVELEAISLREQTQRSIEADDARRARNAKKEQAARKAAQQAAKTVAASRSEAIKHYTALKDQHPRYCLLEARGGAGASGCVDEVLHHLAYELEQDGKVDQARKVYLELIQRHPTSPYLPGAYLAFGELFFGEAQADPSKWPLAEQSYKKVLEYPPPENTSFGYAHYKLAYVYWNQGDHARALSELKRTVEHAAAFPKAPSGAGLAAAARRDLVPIYAQTGDATKAHDFFRPLSGDATGDASRTYAMMDDLGQAYLDTGHYQDAIALYQDLLARDRGPRSCIYQARISEAVMAARSGNKDAIAGQLAAQATHRARFAAEGHPDAAKLACDNVTAGLLAETAMAWHLEAVGSGGVRGTGDDKTMRLAAELYDRVTGTFTAERFARFTFPRLVKEDWPTLRKLAYHKADLLYFQKDWARCGPAFDAVVAQDPKGPLAEAASYGSATCYQNVYLSTHSGGRDRASAGQLPGAAVARVDATSARRFQARALTDAQKAMLASFDRYVCGVAGESADKELRERLVEIKFARARTWFEAQRWEEAALGFRDIAFTHAASEAGVDAAQLYLESLNILAIQSEPARPTCIDRMAADTPRIVALYCAAGRTGARVPAEDCEKLDRVAQDLERREAERIVVAAASAKDPAAAYDRGARAYLAIWEKRGREACEKKEPGCERMDEILHNAAKAFQAARLLAKAIAVRKTLVDPRYGLERKELARQAVYDIGANYQAIAVYDEAARWYERFARESPTLDKASDALRDAVILRLGTGELTAALEDAALFARAFGAKQPAQAAHVAMAIGAHHVEREDWAEARRQLAMAMPRIDRSAALDVQIQAHALLGRALARTGSAGPAAAEYERVRGMLRDTARVRERLDALGGDEVEKQRRLGKVLSALGEALFFAAEQKRRTVDAIRFPVYAGSGSRDDVLRHVNVRVAEWIQRKRPAIEALEKEYLAVLEVKPVPPAWAIASGARVGQMWSKFVAEFRAAPIPNEWKQSGMSPHGVTWEELRAAYYEALDKASEPQKQRAKAAYESCLRSSVTYQHFDQHSRVCEGWLARTYPAEYHQVDELRAAPTRIASGLSERGAPAMLRSLQ